MCYASIVTSRYGGAKRVAFGGHGQTREIVITSRLASRAKLSYLIAYQLGCLAAIVAPA